MIDTHTHLYIGEDFPGDDAPQAIERALEAGVGKMVLANVDAASVAPIEEMIARFPGHVYAVMGMHPTEINPQTWERDLDFIEGQLHAPGVVGIGEVGIDLHFESESLPLQKEVFRRQLQWAQREQMPVAIHQRDALEELLEVIQSVPTDRIPAFEFHCFTYGPGEVRRVREVLPDAYFGIGGVVTFKNAPSVREALHLIGLERIVLETDAPYLSPVPKRGTRNESANIPYIAAAVAAELGVPVEEVKKQTDINSLQLFPLLDQ